MPAGFLLLRLDKPENKQHGANRNNDDSSSVHENLTNICRNQFSICHLPSAICLRNGIMSAFPKRMAAANSLRYEPASGYRAPRTDCVNRVLRASRREAAARCRAKEKNLRRRNRPAINANRKNQNGLEQVQNIFP
jgi:hypothetical protein